MRLREIERGDGLFYRLLIRFISAVSGMRLPDAARIVMYHKDFYGNPMTSWTHAAMRGKSDWSIGERELIAAIVAKWNACTFCIDAHSAIAALELGKPLVKIALEDFRQANVSVKLHSALVFLEKLTQSSDKLTVEDAQTVLHNGVTPEALEDAIAITTLFSITVRCADTFNFAILKNKEVEHAAKRMFVQGYALGKSKEKTPAHPNHRALAETLRQRIFEGPGTTDTALRQAMAKRVTGGPPMEVPYDDLALQIGKAACKVTDAQVTNVIKSAGSEKATFELIIAAAVSAGLGRWKRGLRVLEGAAR